MPRGIYIGVSSTAKKVKTAYIGVNQVAKRITKAYIGIGGVARPCYSSSAPTIEYYGVIDPLTEYNNDRFSSSASMIGDYAVFPLDSSTDGYNSSLTKVSTDNGNYAYQAAVNFSNYIIFAGGQGETNMEILNIVHVLRATDASLTRSTIAGTTLSSKRSLLAAATVGNYMLFGGGGKDTGFLMVTTNAESTVDAFDTSFTKIAVANLNEGKAGLSAATIANHALFVGGRNTSSDETNSAEAYDTSLTKTNIASLIENAYCYSAATVGNHALFAGGYMSHGLSPCSNNVSYYDEYLTYRCAFLSGPKNQCAAVSIGEYALFGGGDSVDGDHLGSVDIFDNSITLFKAQPLSFPRMGLSAAATGDFILFAGGYNVNVVEAYVNNTK